MAIGPESFKKELQATANRYEEIIDRMLSKSTVNYGNSISIDIPSGLRSDIWSILEKRYLAAGWKEAKWHSDQRDGSYLVFKM
ncbi:MAG: hypothetical protein WC979_02255 [Candidatus Pacearchaeota archaeon]|jgi:hypothetical protein|nr:hypothetical protein [Clostridia bacterium]